MKLTKQFYLKFKFCKFLRFHQKKKKKKKNDDDIILNYFMTNI